jgi:hypothetical protein
MCIWKSIYRLNTKNLSLMTGVGRKCIFHKKCMGNAWAKYPAGTDNTPQEWGVLPASFYFLNLKYFCPHILHEFEKVEQEVFFDLAY